MESLEAAEEFLLKKHREAGDEIDYSPPPQDDLDFTGSFNFSAKTPPAAKP